MITCHEVTRTLPQNHPYNSFGVGTGSIDQVVSQFVESSPSVVTAGTSSTLAFNSDQCSFSTQISYSDDSSMSMASPPADTASFLDSGVLSRSSEVECLLEARTDEVCSCSSYGLINPSQNPDNLQCMLPLSMRTSSLVPHDLYAESSASCSLQPPAATTGVVHSSDNFPHISEQDQSKTWSTLCELPASWDSSGFLASESIYEKPHLATDWTSECIDLVQPSTLWGYDDCYTYEYLPSFPIFEVWKSSDTTIEVWPDHSTGSMPVTSLYHDIPTSLGPLQISCDWAQDYSMCVVLLVVLLLDQYSKHVKKKPTYLLLVVVSVRSSYNVNSNLKRILTTSVRNRRQLRIPDTVWGLHFCVKLGIIMMIPNPSFWTNKNLWIVL